MQYRVTACVGGTPLQDKELQQLAGSAPLCEAFWDILQRMHREQRV